MNAPTIGILFLGGAKRVTMAQHLIRAAASYGLTARIVSYELTFEEPIASVATIVEGLRWSDPRVVDDLRRVIREHDINILLPFVDGAIEIASAVAALEQGVYCPVCSPDLAHAFYDKRLSAELFEQAGIDIPATLRAGQEPAFPLIAKPRCGSASAGIRLLRSMEDLKELDNPDDYLIQEYVEGAEEYTVDCFVSADGSARTFSPRRRIATLGGEVIRTATVDSPELLTRADSDALALDLTGAFTIQYLCRSGHFMLMEINPRLGGGATASVAAGADIPAMIIEEATGRPIITRAARPGVVTARCFRDVSFLDGKLLQ